MPITMQASCKLHSCTLPRPGACRWARTSDHVQCSAQHHTGQGKRGSRPAQLPLLPPALLALVPAAWAEDLDEAGQQAVESLRSPYQFSGPKAVYPGTEAAKSAADAAGISLPDVQLPSLPSGLADSLLDNPLLVVGGLALLAIPLIAIGLTGSGSKVKGVSAAKALDELANNPSAVIIDLRNKADVKEEGSPDLRSVKARLNSLPFTKVGSAVPSQLELACMSTGRRVGQVALLTTSALPVHGSLQACCLCFPAQLPVDCCARRL